jgi:hypothetical protein
MYEGVKGRTSLTKDPGADEAQKKVYNVFAVFMIDVIKKSEARWERVNDRRKRNKTSN